MIKEYCRKTFLMDKFDNSRIQRFLTEIDPDQKMEVIMGSGLVEGAAKDLLIGKRFNRGNSIKSFKQLKSKDFFRNLKKLNIRHPHWSLNKRSSKEWIAKSFDTQGGQKIWNKLKKNFVKNEKIYFQKIISGEHISVQFFLKKKNIKILCYCNQYFSPSHNKPFIIKALTTTQLSEKVKKNIFTIIKKISNFYKLNGLNSIDLIINKENDVIVIEINPRTGLSLNILIRIFGRNLINFKNITTTKSSNLGTLIIYSPKRFINSGHKFKFVKKLSNSKNFSELPNENQKIEKNEPICLVHFTFKK